MLVIEWAGWYKRENSDKLWGVLKDAQEEYYNFWCRRGAKMQFKHTNTRKFQHKFDKGYREISDQKLEEIYPGFMDEATRQLAFGKLCGTVR